MLILSRKENESIRIGEDVVITVSHIKGNRVQIAIEAPREVAIRREELKIDGTEPKKPVATQSRSANRLKDYLRQPA